jgi:hypothetical protein
MIFSILPHPGMKFETRNREEFAKKRRHDIVISEDQRRQCQTKYSIFLQGHRYFRALFWNKLSKNSAPTTT